MSFKRDGDDYGGLGILKKRRVAELFSNDIPDGEALLCSNGRFACTVCKHKPVFDTVNMLAVHRKGKKHLANAAMVTAEREDLANLVVKRQQEVYLGGGNANIIASSGPSTDGILTAPEYDPRARRLKIKPYDRKPRLDISRQQASQSPERTLNSSNHTFKNFKKDYLRQQEHKINSSVGFNGSNSLPKCGGQEQNDVPLTVVSTKPLSDSTPCQEKTISAQTAKPEPNYVHQKYFKKRQYICDRVSQTSVPEEEREKREKLLQLRGAGWKKDWSGKWVKEEGVEFDSDEEPPDIN